jgi:hypothetical protein
VDARVASCTLLPSARAPGLADGRTGCDGNTHVAARPP